MSMEQEAPSPSPVHAGSRVTTRAGGLVTAGRGVMAPVFTVLMTVGFLDVVLLLLVPFSLTRYTESPWSSSGRLGFLALAVGAGILFGIITAVAADRRNRSPWWFLAGHAGTFAAPLMAAIDWDHGIPLAASWGMEGPGSARMLVLLLCAVGSLVAFTVFSLTPVREHPPPPGPLLRGLGRFFHGAGNIYLGISLLILLVAGLFYGTFVENDYSHRAAKYLVYTAPWFGTLLLAFSVSLISATLRKYPWRVDQTGWLVVHAALVLLLIGTFMTFWGKREGSLTLSEGEAGSSFPLDGASRLVVQEAVRSKDRFMGFRPVWRSMTHFDQNPAETEPRETYRPEGPGGRDLGFTITVDRYFPHGEPQVSHLNSGSVPSYAVKLETRPPGRGATPSTGVLSENGAPISLGRMLVLRIRRAREARVVDAVLAGAPTNGDGEGTYPVPPGELWFVAGPRGRLVWGFHASSGAVRAGPVEAGRALPLGIPLELRVLEVYDHYVRELSYEFGGYESRRQVCRLRIGGDGELMDAGADRTSWIFRGQESNLPLVRSGDSIYRISWNAVHQSLGFQLKLEDFHRDYYPGSTQPRTFESKLWLRDKRHPEPRLIKIDMNHPLRYKGWRLYQARFSEGRGTETTILQVNRDPGLNTVTYPACAVLTLGLVIVFFQKRGFLFPLAACLRRRKTAPMTRFLASLGVVGLAFLATLPGVAIFVLLGEGPLMLLGPLSIVLGLVLETLLVTGPLARRLKRAQPIGVVPVPVKPGAPS